MGFIHQDPCKGVHIETRRESMVLYTDNGAQRVELTYEDWIKALPALAEAMKSKAGPFII
jgi:hypothetical protein